MSGTNWYVLHVITGRELEIKRELEERTGVQAVVPREEQQLRKGGAWYTQLSILFPGYVFIVCGWSADLWHRIDKIDGIIRVLNDPIAPIPLTVDEINDLLVLANEGNPIVATDVLHEDDKIIILSGALKHFEGQLIKIVPRQKRATILVKIFGSERLLSLPINYIKKSI